MKIKKIYVIAAQHGNEVFGLKILNNLQLMKLSGLSLRIGNPEAIAKQRSFVESDLNRSYGKIDGPPTKEAKLADTIIKEIELLQPDLILDIHTAKAKVGKVGILAQDRPLLKQVAMMVGLEQVAIMPPDIHHTSLIGQYPACSISLEFGKGYRSDTLAQNTAQRIAALLGKDMTPALSTKLPTYEVQRTIKPHEAPVTELTNYVYNQKVGGYPFLVSETGYKAHQHLGFLAVKKES